MSNLKLHPRAMPAQFPLWVPLVIWYALDRLQPPDWIWGLSCVFVVGLITMIVRDRARHQHVLLEDLHKNAEPVQDIQEKGKTMDKLINHMTLASLILICVVFVAWVAASLYNRHEEREAKNSKAYGPSSIVPVITPKQRKNLVTSEQFELCDLHLDGQVINDEPYVCRTCGQRRHLYCRDGGMYVVTASTSQKNAETDQRSLKNAETINKVDGRSPNV